MRRGGVTMGDQQDHFNRNGGLAKPAAPGSGDSWPRRVEELEQQLAEARRELEEAKRRYLRAAADFDNYRKRVERDHAAQAVRLQKELLLDLVDLLDGLEQAKKQVQEPSALQGVELILRQFHEVLRKHGCTPMECLGEPYDPGLHEGLAFAAAQDCDPGCVAGEIQRGYKYRDELLRPAKVIVARRPEAD